jgi:hypothetical protein
MYVWSKMSAKFNFHMTSPVLRSNGDFKTDIVNFFSPPDPPQGLVAHRRCYVIAT